MSTRGWFLVAGVAALGMLSLGLDVPGEGCRVVASDVGPGWVYSSGVESGVWTDAGGSVVGFADEEDSIVYDRPGCAPLYGVTP